MLARVFRNCPLAAPARVNLSFDDSNLSAELFVRLASFLGECGLHDPQGLERQQLETGLSLGIREFSFEICLSNIDREGCCRGL